MMIFKKLTPLIFLTFFFIDKSCAYTEVKNHKTRTYKTINKDWFFHLGDINYKEKKDYADWEKVNIPHNWGWKEAQKGNKNYYRGPGWYRKTLHLKKVDHKRYFIKFEAASTIADVYINGKHVGQHKGGFASFVFEITKYIDGDTQNIDVRVSNEKTYEIAPISGGFNIYGGIYRSVHIIETPSVCFSNTDYASSGVRFQQTSITEDKAVIDITALVSNGTKKSHKFYHHPLSNGKKVQKSLYEVECKLIDHNNKVVSKTNSDLNLVAFKKSREFIIPVQAKLTLKNPHLWNGIKDPYLYKAVIELKKGDVIIDRLEENLGLRFFNVDPDKGFFLNGKPYRLRGVCKHQDKKDKGWAVIEKDLDLDMVLIKEMGANAVRCSHYQHSEYFYKLCDQEGLLVYPEIGQVNVVNHDVAYVQNSHQQLLELVRQNFNRCSIFSWGLYNEIKGFGGDPHMIISDQNKLVKGEDPTRYTIAATSHMQMPWMNKITDLLCWNRYPGWYDPYAHLVDFNEWPKYRTTSKNGGWAFSEYGGGANIEHHEQNPAQPVPKSFWHPEEWQTIAHEGHMKQFNQHPYIWGTFIWNMFDFANLGQTEGGKVGMNDKGMITFDRKSKKDAFYFYKVNWNPEPMIHITSKRHHTRHIQKTPIKVYCNVKSKVELWLNDKKIGTKKPDDFNIIKWNNIELQKGVNKVLVKVEKSGKTLEDSIEWKYNPNYKSLKPKTMNTKRISGDGGIGHEDRKEIEKKK